MTLRTLNELETTYHEWVQQHPQAADDFQEAIEDILTDAGITYDRVTSRVKEWRSFKTKALKTRDDGSFVYDDPWHDIVDRVGVRITTFHSTVIPRVVDVLREYFTLIKQVDKAAETRISGGFGYGSHHLILSVGDKIPELSDFQGMIFEVQIRTVLQHAWAEFEHDIRYKGAEELDPRVDRAFALAAGLIELADQQFDQIALIKEEAPVSAMDAELTKETLPGALAVLVGTRFPRSKTEYYGWMEELLVANGITTVSDLRDLLNDTDISELEATMRYQFTPSQVRIVDDLLLKRFGELHIERTKHSGNRVASRPARLTQRLKVMRAAAIAEVVSRYQDTSKD